MSILKYPLATEKSVGHSRQGQHDNIHSRLEGDKDRDKEGIREEFNVKVKSIRTINMPKNNKKAFIKLAKGYNATDVAVKLKLV